MEIKTKYNVSSLVKRKFDACDPAKKVILLEVMEVISQTCYAGTQVFYSCKQIFATKWGDKPWEIGHGIAREDNQNGWRKYREDELVTPTDEEISIITGKPLTE